MRNKGIIIFLIIALTIIGLVIFDPTNTPTNEENSYKTLDSQFLEEHPKAESFSTYITGEEMKELTLAEVAGIWEVDEILFLDKIKTDYQENATLSTLIKEIPELNSRPIKLKNLLDNLE